MTSPPLNRFQYLSQAIANSIQSESESDSETESTLSLSESESETESKSRPESETESKSKPESETETDDVEDGDPRFYKCLATTCTPDHDHDWKRRDDKYSYGPYMCTECKHLFYEMTSEVWNFPNCESCRNDKIAIRKKSRPRRQRRRRRRR